MLRLFLLLCIGYLLPAMPAAAMDSEWSTGKQARARLVPAVTGMGELQHISAALDLQISPGWHTYWRVPGDAGLPPRLDWAGSGNVADVAMLYPAPVRIQELDLTVFGYRDSLFLPLKITPQKPGESLSLRLKAEIMVCHEICIPETFQLVLDIPAAAAAPAAEATRIDDALKRRVPATENTVSLAIDTVVLGPDALVIAARSKNTFKSADVFAVVGDRVFTAMPEITPDAKDPRRALIRIAKPSDIDDLNGFLKGKTLNLTISDGGSALARDFQF